MATYQLDLKRLLCPMPVIKTQKQAKRLSSGDILNITVTDRGALHDIPAWCRIAGHKLVDSQEADGVITMQIEVGDKHGE
jgi:tRNA 2-thiouridine synthesizing protein A